jgi:hypothetical protein
MKPPSGKIDDFEAACLDGRRVGWFGSYALHEVKRTVTPGGGWWSGDELAVEPPPTMGARELDRRAAGY